MEYQLPKVLLLRVRLPSLYFLSFSQPSTEKLIVEDLEALENGRKMTKDPWILEGLHGVKPQAPP